MSVSEPRTSRIIGTVGPIAVVGGAIVFAIYMIYNYLNAGLSGAENNYKYWLSEITVELKEWYADNAKNGVQGLTPEQESLLRVKEDYLQTAYSTYIDQLQARNLPISNFIYDIIAGAVIVGGLVALGKAGGFRGLLGKVPADKTKQIAENTLAQVDMLMHAVAYDFAYEGDVGTASMIQLSTGNMYSTHYLPGLNSQITLFTQTLLYLSPGTIPYITTTNMLAAAQTIVATDALPAINAYMMLPILGAE